MKNYSGKTNKKVDRFAMPSRFKAMGAEASKKIVALLPRHPRKPNASIGH